MREIQLNEYKDFKYALDTLKSYGFTETTDASVIPANTFCWNNDYKAIRVNDGAVNKKGVINIKGFPALNIGDTVEISAEIMNLSGVKAKIAVDYIDPLANLFVLQSSGTVNDGFEVLQGSFLINHKRRFEVLIGAFTGDIGDFYVRNVQITVKTQDNKAFIPDQRLYTLYAKPKATSFELMGYHPYRCTINTTSDYVEIVHEEPFGGVDVVGGSGVFYNGSGFATMSATGMDNIVVKVNGEAFSRLRVHFYDMTTGQKVSPATILASANEVYIGVMHFAYR